MQDRHVTYHEIKACLGISSTSIHSILHDSGRKKDLFSLDPAQFDDRSNKALDDCCIEMLEKYDCSASTDVYKIVPGDESWIAAYEPETMQQPTV